MERNPSPTAKLPGGSPLSSARTTPLADGPKSAAPSNVRPIDPEMLRRIFGQVDFIERYRFVPSPPVPPTLGERLVDFFLRNQTRIGIASLIFATVVGCYFAFRIGYGS